MSSRDLPRPPPAQVVLTAGLGLALAGLTLLVDLDPGWLRALDGGVADPFFAATSGHPLPTFLWELDATLEQPWALRGVLLLAALALVVRRRRLLAGWLVAVVVLETVLAPGAKSFLDRARPTWPDPIQTLSSSSYPSGHASAGGAFVAALLVVLPVLLGASLRRRLLATAVVVAGLVVCADRLFLGVHYLSDVVGGVLLGALLVHATLLLVPPGARAPADVTRR